MNKTCTTCDKKLPKNSGLPTCNACARVKRDARNAENRAVIATGKCPICGSALKRNYSMTGWWVCEQVGAETHRARPQEPSCSWQAFVD